MIVFAAVAVGASFALPRGGAKKAGGPKAPRATAVAAVAAERGRLVERGRYPGELAADAAEVAAFYGGRVVAVRVRVGDVVAAGDVLVELDPVDAREQVERARAQVAAAEAEVARAEADLAVTETQLGRFEELVKDRAVSQQEVDTLRARVAGLRSARRTAAARGDEARAGVRLLRKRITESVVRAPFAGRVAERHVDPGALVSAGARLVRLVATAPLRARFEVPEGDVAGLAVGASLRVVTERGATDPAAGAPARVTGIAGEVTRARRTVLVEAVIDAPPAGWLAGMYAEAVVDRRTIPEATIVPEAALVSRLGDDGAVAHGVFVLTEAPPALVARWAPVTVVAREGERVAIDGAVAVGERVLVAGHADLVDRSPVTLVPPAPAPDAR